MWVSFLLDLCFTISDFNIIPKVCGNRTNITMQIRVYDRFRCTVNLKYIQSIPTKILRWHMYGCCGPRRRPDTDESLVYLSDCTAAIRARSNTIWALGGVCISKTFLNAM